jgi:hypothetical protein
MIAITQIACLHKLVQLATLTYIWCDSFYMLGYLLISFCLLAFASPSACVDYHEMNEEEGACISQPELIKSQQKAERRGSKQIAGANAPLAA